MLVWWNAMDNENKEKKRLLQEINDLRRQIETCKSEVKSQREYFQNLFQNSAVPTFVISNNHQVVLWNRACEEMTGIEAKNIVGTNEQWKPFYSQKRQILADLVIDQYIEKLPLFYSAHSKSKFIPEGLQAEGWYSNIGGMERYISFNAAPIRNNAGDIIAAVETFEDLTEIKRAEQRLEASEKRYRVLFEDSPAIMLVIDPDTIEIVSANEAALSFYGYSRHNLIGKSVAEIMELPQDHVLRLLKEITNGTLLVQGKHRLESGEIRDVEMSPGPINIDGTTYLFSIIHDITERKAAEEAAREGENKLQAITSLASDAIIMINDQGNVCYWNIAAEKMFDYTGSEMMGRNLELIMPQYFRQAHRKAFKKFVATGDGEKIGKIYEVSALHKDGTEFPIELSISGLLLKGRWHAVGVIRDITGRKNLEMQLRQAQKMEAIGTLAGGVAHDFNNILTVIIGNGTLLTMNMAKDDPLVHNVQQILVSAERAVSLTQSLLTFSRKTPLETRTVNLNDIIAKAEKLLARLLREDITIRSRLTTESTMILADPVVIEQILMNLATNARDAMPTGGTFIIGTEIVELDREFIRVHGYGKLGRYVSLTCSDSGVGMDKETTQRIFEPFFTTKEAGKGTGLGLAIVYGIIKQHDGFINCYSEPGKGTIFRIYLPLVHSVQEEEAGVLEAPPVGGTETILLAEDDIATRNLTRRILETFGYTVIEAEDGEDAIVKFKAQDDQIDMVMLDVIMPKRNGKEACLEIQRIQPKIKCLFTSGYPPDISSDSETNGESFIPKPIIPTLLLKKIREILG
jgi:PAS domain S-box-containing protein